MKEVSFCQKINKEDGFIEWHKYSAQEVLNRWRAFIQWPGIYTLYNGKRLKIIEAYIVDGTAEPGQAVQVDDMIGVACKDGILGLKKVQLEGKNVMKIGEFVKGYGGFVGSELSGST